MIKRIICLGVFLVVCLGMFSGCANDYAYKEGDFSLIVKADKTEVSVGDTIKVTATLKNLSGRNICIQMSHPDYKKLEDMILIGLFEEGTEHEFVVTDIGGPRRKMRIKKDAVITRLMEFHIDKTENYDAVSSVVFYTGNGYNEGVSIFSEAINIIIKE